MKRGLIAIAGAGIVIVIFSLVMTPTYASDHGLIIGMHSTDQVWRAEYEETITFDSNPLQRLLTAYKVKITKRYEYDSEEGRSTKVTYRIYSNEVYVDEITDSYDISSGSGGGWYEPIPIPPGTIRSGENTVRIHISFNSTTTEPRKRPDSFEFHIDSAIITDNIRLATLTLIVFTSSGIIYGTRTRGQRVDEDA